MAYWLSYEMRLACVQLGHLVIDVVDVPMVYKIQICNFRCKRDCGITLIESWVQLIKLYLVEVT